MRFQASVFKLGNGRGIYIPPKVYIHLELGKKYEWEVYIQEKESDDLRQKIKEIEDRNVYTKEKNVYTKPELSSELELIPDESTQRPNNFKSS